MLAALAIAWFARLAFASTYAAYVPLDSSIYDELDTLNDLGFARQLPFGNPADHAASRRRASRSRPSRELSEMQDPNELARSCINALRLQLPDEVQWIEQDHEDNLPTMFHPVDRVEGAVRFVAGQAAQSNSQTKWTRESTSRKEPRCCRTTTTSSPIQGSNEILRWSGWSGIRRLRHRLRRRGAGGSTEPTVRARRSRAQLLTGAVVVSLGNTCDLRSGRKRRRGGCGHYNQLSQSNNAAAVPGAAHPEYPSEDICRGIFRYLGLYRYQAFLGQLNADRTFARPWLSGQVITFKTLPYLEWGLDHTIMFGGSGNDNYGPLGFVGDLTGLCDGKFSGCQYQHALRRLRQGAHPAVAQYADLWRGTGRRLFSLPFGKSRFKLPFKGPSYVAGIYVPQVTLDGRTTARFEYTLTDKEYSVHNDSLYWSYNNALMGSSLGPGAWQVDFEIDRWLNCQSRIGVDAFYTRRAADIAAATFVPLGRNTETGYGVAFDLLHLPLEISPLANSLGEMKARAGIEYVSDINYSTDSSLRALLQLSFAFTPSWGGLVWR